jgi:hypothetical protein
MPLSPLTLYLKANDAQISVIEEVTTPPVKLGAAYWQSLRGHRKFPARSELTLRGMARFLSHVIIIRVEDNGADYEYRYVGETQRQAYGIPLKGIRLSQIEAAAPQLGVLLRCVYEQVRSTAKTLVIRGRALSASADERPQFQETVWMPLGDSDTCVDHLLMVGVQVPRPYWETPADKLEALADHGRASVLAGISPSHLSPTGR